MKYLKKIEWLPDALSDGTIVTPTGPFTLSPEEAIKYADYRFNKQQSMMPYNTVIALNRGEDCADRNTGNITFTKTFLSKIGKAPVIIKSVLLPPNTITGDTEFDKTYPFWCLAVTIVSSEIDLTGKYLCLEACNTGHTHQPHAWSYKYTSFYTLPFAAKKYLRGDVVKYKTLPDSQSFSFTIDKGEAKLSLEGITQIENPKVGKTYYLYIALPEKYLRYKDRVCSKSLINEEDYNTYIKFRPCIKYKRENTNDVNMYTLPLSWPYELNCKFPQIFYRAWSTNTTTLPPPSITVSQTVIRSTYVGKTAVIDYDIEWPVEDAQIEISSSQPWVKFFHDPINKQITVNIPRTTSTSNRTAYITVEYSGAISQQINITQLGVPVINLESNTVSANSLGGVFNVSYTVNNPLDNVTISTSESYDWISVDVESSHIVITISENTNTSSRSGTIYVSYTGASQKTINVSQEACPVITIKNSTISLSYNATGTYTRNYSITNPIDGEVVTCSKSSHSWFTFSHDSNNQKITINVTSANNSSISRTGYIYLDYENATRKTITISQGTKPTTTTTTTAATTSYKYTIYANITGVSGSVSRASISAIDNSTGKYGISTNYSGTSLSITATFTFYNKPVSSMKVTATVSLTNGSQYTGSTTVTPLLNGTKSVNITVSSGLLSVSDSGMSPDTLSGDSNSLEDILVDYETDQI